MVTSEGLASVDPWLYRQGFNVDSWLLSDAFSHDNDLLARALHTTVTATPHTLTPSSAFFDSAAVSHPSSTTNTLSSNVSGGSDPEIIGGGAKRKRNCLLTDGKTAKRRARASKKSQTTFITADPSNFRQMVQQVTGSRYIDDSPFGMFDPIVKPEPLRLVNKLPCGLSDRSTAVPMLDTSAFLSNHHQENLAVGNAYSAATGVGLTSGKPNATADAGVSADDFENYPTFPTLESWKVM
ncbi:atcambp25-binding protein OF 25 KDA [Arabidopsis lyrata subsp. lyrata]|uniref:Atcambp25-binding protein OF 25 kDa n=1 Tax=Arabidopsis lyrata subsp. lyrata TaxID=81972 RepID=D7LGI4_ARALL|nr:calmodulin-binding protein 25 [Arabidopsis lyrata subsp. lyrata]EFH58014.1 atcambp25-binding protein OF 25 KDA [Arabidopsis lyrata subsp. lyrata]|eukprot:XP_002881755.1 calmodulin-binding protein 25 [Arabidopsis lyrata subsp. lyrata]